MFDIQIDGAHFQHLIEPKVKNGFSLRNVNTNCELIAVFSGVGKLSVNASVIDIKPYNLYLVPPRSYYCLYVEKDSSFECFNFSIPSSYFNFNFSNVFNSMKVINIVSENDVLAWFDRLKKYEKNINNESEDFEIILKCLTQELIIRLKTVKGQYSFTKTKNELIIKAINFIDANIEQNLTVEKIALKLAISRSYLQNSFLKEMKMGIKSYIIRKKMDKARSLIIGGERATEVAAKLGYKTYSSFFKSYKKMFNDSPKKSK